MAWKLWKTEKRYDETRSWPSGTHESLKQLLDMYLGGDSPPFANWAAPGITFAPEVETLARDGVRGYQLALWLWLFAEKHGTIAAKMVRESLCLLADAMQPSSGDKIDSLLDLENRLAHSVEDLSAQQRTFRLEGLSVELPMEFFLATAFLRLAPDSPYAGNEGTYLQGNDFKLADCFHHATEEGLAVFRPMIDAVDFDAKSLPNWRWSAHPGAAERHLQRRHKNPLFALHRQMVTAHEVYEARLADARAIEDIRTELNETSRSFSETTELPLNWQPSSKDTGTTSTGLTNAGSSLADRARRSAMQLQRCAPTYLRPGALRFTRTGTVSRLWSRKKRNGLSDGRCCMDASGRPSF
ncbi:hypothetical protein [Paraburkholderia sp. 40]|uniref:hypothetical protein n=1 Tax=Paraburkholderia sp. 40 TaxID=2991059 RepID=UPI003D18FE83